MLRPTATDGRRERAFIAISRFMPVVAVLALVSLMAEHGGYMPLRYVPILQAFDVGIISAFVLENFIKLFLARDRKSYLQSNIPDFVVIALFPLYFLLLQLLYFLPTVKVFLEYVNIRSAAKLYIVVIQVGIVASLLLKALKAHAHLERTRFRPAQMLVATFLIIIAFGIVCLYAPRAVSSEFVKQTGKNHLSLEDAIFTATSAVCVTGLIVRDTGGDFSRGGQIVILCLIQIGGLGLMTIVSFFALVLGRGMGLRERAVMQDVLSFDMLSQISRMIIYILIVTFSFELVGAVLLYGLWRDIDVLERGSRIYLSIFHSISGFCNAGFSLLSTSFRHYRASLRLNLVMGTLIIVGGLGFVVQRNVATWLWVRLKALFRRVPPAELPRISLQAKLVLVLSGCLLVGGFLVFLFLELGSPVMGASVKDKLLAASFQSTTARTAGFNTAPTNKLSIASKFVTIILMFIGASPGSTGGGVKTVTFGVLLFAIFSMVRNRQRVEAFKRTVPRLIASRALAVVILALFVVALVTTCLSVTERGQDHSFMDLLFETVSAFATVGLSTGVTPTLSTLGKLLLSVTMLTGRIGPLTLMVALGQRIRTEEYEYPEEAVMIG